MKGINHLVLAGHDLEAMRSHYARLGFTVTPRGQHPFGTGNSEPRFVFPNLRVLKSEIVGKDHVRCIFGDGGASTRLKGIAFRVLGSPRQQEMGKALLSSQGAGFHLAGHLRADSWQGRDEVQLLIDDAAVAR